MKGINSSRVRSGPRHTENRSMHSTVRILSLRSSDLRLSTNKTIGSRCVESGARVFGEIRPCVLDSRSGLGCAVFSIVGFRVNKQNLFWR
jgi:hypothetical protein